MDVDDDDDDFGFGDEGSAPLLQLPLPHASSAPPSQARPVVSLDRRLSVLLDDVLEMGNGSLIMNKHRAPSGLASSVTAGSADDFPDELDFGDDEELVFDESSHPLAIGRAGSTSEVSSPRSSASPHLHAPEDDGVFASPRGHSPTDWTLIDQLSTPLDANNAHDLAVFGLAAPGELPSFVRYKTSELIIFHKYVLDVRSQLNLVAGGGSLDVLVTVMGMLDGLRKSLQKSLDANLLAPDAFAQLQHNTLDRLQRFVDELALLNSRRALRRSQNRPWASQPAGSVQAARSSVDDEYDALSAVLARHPTMFDCLEGRNAVTAVLRLCRLVSERARRSTATAATPTMAGSRSSSSSGSTLSAPSRTTTLELLICRLVTTNTKAAVATRVEEWKAQLSAVGPLDHARFAFVLTDVHERYLALERALSMGTRELSHHIVLESELSSLLVPVRRSLKVMWLAAASSRPQFATWLQAEADELADAVLSDAPLTSPERMRQNTLGRCVSLLYDLTLLPQSDDTHKAFCSAVLNVKLFLSRTAATHQLQKRIQSGQLPGGSGPSSTAAAAAGGPSLIVTGEDSLEFRSLADAGGDRTFRPVRPSDARKRAQQERAHVASRPGHRRTASAGANAGSKLSLHGAAKSAASVTGSSSAGASASSGGEQQQRLSSSSSAATLAPPRSHAMSSPPVRKSTDVFRKVP